MKQSQPTISRRFPVSKSRCSRFDRKIFTDSIMTSCLRKLVSIIIKKLYDKLCDLWRKNSLHDKSYIRLSVSDEQFRFITRQMCPWPDGTTDKNVWSWFTANNSCHFTVHVVCPFIIDGAGGVQLLDCNERSVCEIVIGSLQWRCDRRN